MPVVIYDQDFYRTAESCRMIGVSRNALFVRSNEGMISDASIVTGGPGDYSPQPNWRPLEERPTMLSR